MSDTIIIFDQTVAIDTTYLSLVFVEQLNSTELMKIRKLSKLTTLNASNYLLNDEHLEIIGSIAGLETLHLVMTEITDEGIAYLGPLIKLQELRLKDNPQLTDACIPHLAMLQALKLIHLGNTDISVEGLTELMSKVALTTLILDSELDEYIEPLLQLSREYPKLEILLKGTGTIAKGTLNS
jgi:hypothetical protein